MSEWKEVWHVWDGNLDADKIIDQNGRTISKNDFNPTSSFRRFKKCGGFNSVVYTTGQKRRRVECVRCEGDGIIFESIGSTDVLVDDCQSCNGKGYTWEYK